MEHPEVFLFFFQISQIIFFKKILINRKNTLLAVLLWTLLLPVIADFNQLDAQGKRVLVCSLKMMSSKYIYKKKHKMGEKKNLIQQKLLT